jgi:hypothetical protein
MTELIPTPTWITDSYRPELIEPHYTVEVTSDGFLLHEIDLAAFNPYTFRLRDIESVAKLTGETIEVKGNLEDLYKWSRENRVEIIGSDETKFGEVLKADPNYVVPMCFGMPSTSISQANLVAHAYEDFLKLVKDYEKNPNDPIVAFKFIDNHPMYWHFQKVTHRLRARRRNADKTVTADGPIEATRIELRTGHGWTRVQVEIIQGKFSFETSGTPYHTQTNYHDYGLDVYSKSMDEAICVLAAKIHANYDLEGNLRNGDAEPNGSN